MTQENLRAPGHEEYQEKVELNGTVAWCDPELIPLLRSLNEVNLITRSHCSGHDDGIAWVAIRMESILNIEIRESDGYNEIILTWDRQPIETSKRLPTKGNK